MPRKAISHAIFGGLVLLRSKISELFASRKLENIIQKRPDKRLKWLQKGMIMVGRSVGWVGRRE